MAENEKTGGEDSPVEKALHHLEEAKAHTQQAEANLDKAEKEEIEAIEELKEAVDEVTVHVIHVNEVQKASFHESAHKTLNGVWDKSYKELDIPRNPEDIFQTQGKEPKSLMPHLGLTLKQAHKEKVIEDYRFGIVSKTGGA